MSADPCPTPLSIPIRDIARAERVQELWGRAIELARQVQGLEDDPATPVSVRASLGGAVERMLEASQCLDRAHRLCPGRIP